jgi:hypothetical protein
MWIPASGPRFVPAGETTGRNSGLTAVRVIVDERLRAGEPRARGNEHESDLFEARH